MKPYVSLITLGVDDIQRSRDFYEGVLDFPTKMTSEFFVAYELNNVVLALYPRESLAKDGQMPDRQGQRLIKRWRKCVHGQVQDCWMFGT